MLDNWPELGESYGKRTPELKGHIHFDPWLVISFCKNQGLTLTLDLESQPNYGQKSNTVENINVVGQIIQVKERLIRMPKINVRSNNLSASCLQKALFCYSVS